MKAPCKDLPAPRFSASAALATPGNRAAEPAASNQFRRVKHLSIFPPTAVTHVITVYAEVEPSRVRAVSCVGRSNEMRIAAMLRSSLLSRVGLSILAGAVALAQTAAPSASAFTADQASNGGGVYAQNCAACHGINMEGSGDAPALVGGSFLLKWRPRMVSELFGEILQTMPANNPGSLSEAAALNATAYILQRNGAAAGQQALSGGATTLISAIATGRAPANAPAQGG